MDAALAKIQQNPFGYQIIHLDIRRAPLQQFPYSAFYFVIEDEIQVIAIAHDARRPRVWRGRR